MTTNEQRIEALEKSLATQRKLLIGLICLFGAGLTVGGTAAVSATAMSSGTTKSKPLHVQLVGERGTELDYAGQLKMRVK